MRAGGAVLVFLTSVGVVGGGAVALKPDLLTQVVDKFSGSEGGPAQVTEVGSAYVKVGTLFVPVVQNGKLRDRLAMRLTIEANNAAAATIVEDNLPRIYDACMRELMARPPEMPSDITSVDIEGVRKRLLAIAESVVGPGQIRSFLISGVIPAHS